MRTRGKDVTLPGVAGVEEQETGMRPGALQASDARAVPREQHVIRRLEKRVSLVGRDGSVIGMARREAAMEGHIELAARRTRCIVKER